MTVAGALALRAHGHFRADDEVVLCITGNGLKTPDVLSETLAPSPVIAARVRDVAALVEERDRADQRASVGASRN